jgi:hypothetical protein
MLSYSEIRRTATRAIPQGIGFQFIDRTLNKQRRMFNVVLLRGFRRYIHRRLTPFRTLELYPLTGPDALQQLFPG